MQQSITGLQAPFRPAPPTASRLSALSPTHSSTSVAIRVPVLRFLKLLSLPCRLQWSSRPSLTEMNFEEQNPEEQQDNCAHEHPADILHHIV